MKSILESFGFEWRTAPGEAEAELAYLNRIGLIDGILSDDVDNFLFGATTVIRNPSNNLSGNRANPVLNAAGKDDKNHTRVFRLADIKSHPDVRLTRGGMILIGLMSGGDYQQGGLARCGTVTAHGLAKCGFGDSLFQAATSLSREDLRQFLLNWRHELCHELQTNSQGHIGRKQPALAKSVPADFPDVDVLLSYTNPITSESMGRSENNATLTWSKEPDLGKLAGTCEFYFEWGYKEAIIKRFRTVIWHGAVLRILRRAVLDLDAKGTSVGPSEPSTPRKPGKRGPLPCGTPSKMIARHFSSLTLGAVDGDNPDEDERLIIKIHSERRHVSTDGILEYRLEVSPTQLVRITESGIKGTRSPEGPDEWADEDEDEDGAKGTKKPPPDPQSHIRVWMPASMVRVVESALVEDFESIKQRKLNKKTGKGRSKAVGTAKAIATIEEESPGSDSGLPTIKPFRKGAPKSKTKISSVTKSDSTPAIRDLKKKITRTPGDLKSYFTTAKSSNNPPAKNWKVSKASPTNVHVLALDDDDHRTSPRPVMVRDLTKQKIKPIKKALADAATPTSQQHEGKVFQSAVASSVHGPCEDESHHYDSDDPFSAPRHPPTSLATLPITQARKHSPTSSASSSEYIPSHLSKSPRRSFIHTSPGKRSALSPALTGNLSPRATSPSLSRPQPPSRCQLGQPRIIEISDSDDDSVGPASMVPPLLLARARAKSRTKTAPVKLTSMDKFTQPAKPSGGENNLKFIIDLT